MRLRLYAATALVAGLSIVLSACNSNPMAEVRGTVKFDGQAIDDGAILFMAADGASASQWGGPIKNGGYKVQVPPGSMKVTISALKPTGEKKKYLPDAPEKDVVAESIPAKYNAQTELTFEVKSGSNQKDWALVK